MEKINSFRGENYFLSNFFPCKVTVDGIPYGSAEAAFQAQKCATREEMVKFSKMSASEAKKAGRQVCLCFNWESVKYNRMRKVVKAKFEQNPELAKKLLATGDAYLEEGNTWGDRVWGTVNGQGSNNLGKILMDTRDMLRANSETPNSGAEEVSAISEANSTDEAANIFNLLANFGKEE